VTGTESVARLFNTANPTPNFPPTWNMAPTQDAMIVRHYPQRDERHLDLLKWGLLPYFTKDPVHARRPINARAETVKTSGMFKSASLSADVSSPLTLSTSGSLSRAASNPTPSHAGTISP
jgi:putative SOS response-associated peptidase YedK